MMESLVQQVMENQPSEAEQLEVNDLMEDQNILIKVQEISHDDISIPVSVPEWKCFICNIHLTTENSYSVFFSTLAKSGALLSQTLNRTLKTEFLAPHTMRSPVICKICFDLFDELELAEQQCLSLRNTLISGYRKTCELYNQVVEDEVTVGVACQTDYHSESLDLSNVIQKPPIAIKLEEKVFESKVRKSTRKSRTKKKELEPVLEDLESRTSDADDSSGGEDREAQDTHEDNDQEEPLYLDMMDEDMIKSEPNTMSDVEEKTEKPKRKKRKKHRCPKCARTFRRPGELKNHVLVSHVGSNPNQCVYCQKKFNSRNGLYVHLKKIHHVEYSDRKQLVPSLIVDVELADTEPLASYLKKLVEAEKQDESNGASNEEGEDNEQNGSDSEWTEETGSQQKTPTKKSRTSSGRRKEKENLGARGNASQRLSSQCLSEDEKKEVRVKEETEEDEGGREFKEEEEDSGGDNDGGVESEAGGEEKKKKRTSRVGERACMPLIHACPTCGKKWRTVSELNAHIQTHSDLRPFVCEICGQGYKMRKALLVHVGMHNGIHPFTCHYCNKSFTQKIGLVKHMNIHEGNKQYQCDQCGKSFIHVTSYTFHMLVHTGERHVKCSICDLALLSKSHLNRHMLVHTGEKPHECDVCGKRFAKKWNLNVHKKKLHGIDSSSASKLRGTGVRNTTEVDGTDANSSSKLDEIVPRNTTKSHQIATSRGRDANSDGKLTGINAGHLARFHTVDPSGTTAAPLGDPMGSDGVKERTLPPMPALMSPLIQKCTLCPFTSTNRKQSQEHWERDHSRFLNTYPQEYEEYAM